MAVDGVLQEMNGRGWIFSLPEHRREEWVFSFKPEVGGNMFLFLLHLGRYRTESVSVPQQPANKEEKESGRTGSEHPPIKIISTKE